MKDSGENHGDDYYPDIEGEAISNHCLRINATEYFLTVLCVIVNVFQAASIYHYYAVKYISESPFVSVTCWRTCQNMQRSISHSHRKLEIHPSDQTHTHLPSLSRGDILHHRPKHISLLMQYRLQTLDMHTTWSVCACVS